METYIAILRGINVSGHKLIKMDHLITLCVGLGFENTKTYIQSGNIIFQFKKSKNKAIEKLLENALRSEYDFDVPVIIKTQQEMQTVFENNPFLKKRNEDPTKLHATFLNDIPEKSEVDTLQKVKYPPDEFIVDENCIYLFCPNGYGNTKLNNTFLENKLKVSATTRNWKTITSLVKIADETLKNKSNVTK
ncbi:MAG: hypothetical protein K0R26_499 [Bacteroidota bacterium]|jgi:uncharacterized protein (DUF1697 family)|nr:hypothetical protein [Bacteroidota bacterium]